MSWQEIYRELDYIKPRMEFVINKLSEIHTYHHISLSAKNLMIACIPELHKIPVANNMSETIFIHGKEIVKVHMGLGYCSSLSLARRTYTMFQQINYNYTGWEILNTKQLN